MLRFLGEKAEEIPIWINACDVLCLPSYREGCPNVVLETLSCGRPVVASGVGAIPELINIHNGRIFSPGNVNGLAEALKESLNKEWSEQAICDSVKRYTWNESAKKYKLLYKDAIHEFQTKKQGGFNENDKKQLKK